MLTEADREAPVSVDVGQEFVVGHPAFGTPKLLPPDLNPRRPSLDGVVAVALLLGAVLVEVVQQAAPLREPDVLALRFGDEAAILFVLLHER